jgi:tRNA threonylcarbamoyladenosine biosynthesis protein TsaE
VKIISRSVRDTINIGKAMANNLRPGDIICLFGEFGSGKTVLTKGIASGLGIKGNSITSPSFVLIREYAQGKLPLYHFDLYRLESARDIFALGYEEYLYNDGITVIEWADRLKYLMPAECVRIELLIMEGSKRELRFSASGARYKELLGRIHEPRAF